MKYSSACNENTIDSFLAKPIYYMALKNSIENLLKDTPLTVSQLANRLNINWVLINAVTAYRMRDVYEEDDGTLKLLGVTYTQKEKVRKKRTAAKLTVEVMDIIKELAGKVPSKNIVKEIEARTGIKIACTYVNTLIASYGFERFVRKERWTPEMDEFLLAFKPSSWRGSIEERAKALNNKFNTKFTPFAVSRHLFICQKEKQRKNND